MKIFKTFILAFTFSILSFVALSANQHVLPEKLLNHIYDSGNYRSDYKLIAIINMIERTKNHKTDYIQFEVTLDLSVQLAIELDMIKAAFERDIKQQEEYKILLLKNIYDSSDCEQIKNYLHSIENSNERMQLSRSCLDDLDQIRKKYCSWLSEL